MRARRWLWRGGVVLLVTLTVAVVPLACTPALWGWLQGQAFYRGRPTAYWRDRVLAWLHPTDLSTLTTPRPKMPPSAGWLDLLFASPGVPGADPIPEGDAGAIPVLVELLRDPDAFVRLYAIGKLKALGSRAREAVPALLALRRDEKCGRFPGCPEMNLSLDICVETAIEQIDPDVAARPGFRSLPEAGGTP
jgi:hypothetical protein